ncbi:hypothetical protein VIGAN_07124600 [Vigna angularis var. angularis]|uniref:Uncharacterized protein n=1 Tax=Vigna angularis var. angularis TaxID=157739 RepID=A0A0S3SI35_PHAAN|nr:hypothetical protein VIGAN_07124600 [Vigna angularis var. angularis]
MKILRWCSSVRLESGSTKSANNSFPRFGVKWNVAKSGLCHHIRHAGSAAAPRARPRRRLAPLHLPPLIHQKTETHHFFCWIEVLRCSVSLFLSLRVSSCFEKLSF